MLTPWAHKEKNSDWFDENDKESLDALTKRRAVYHGHLAQRAFNVKKATFEMHAAPHNAGSKNAERVMRQPEVEDLAMRLPRRTYIVLSGSKNGVWPHPPDSSIFSSDGRTSALTIPVSSLAGLITSKASLLPTAPCTTLPSIAFSTVAQTGA